MFPGENWENNNTTTNGGVRYFTPYSVRAFSN